jgi:hypothetical protein
VSSSRVAALAMAVATRSAKSPTRAAVSGGRASGPDDPTMADPHRRPSTTIGAPTPERLPGSGMSAAAEPGAFPWLSIRAARPVRNTVAARFSTSSENRPPTGSFVAPGPCQAATRVAAPPVSQRNRAA